MTGITVTLDAYHSTFCLSYPAQRRVTCTLSVLFCLGTFTSNVVVEANGYFEQTEKSKRCQKTRRLFYICSTVFIILFRLNKAHHNFSTVRYVFGYWNLLFRLDVMRFVHICVLPQSIPQSVNLYLNITVPLKLRNGTTSHVVFCYSKKIR